MDLAWTREPNARWDADKQRLIGGAPPGTFAKKDAAHPAGELLGGDWWRVTADGQVVGYGWMDTSWGDAEITMVLAPSARHLGLGSFIVDRLAFEAKARGVNYLYNAIPDGHPDAQNLRDWLVRRGFRPSEDGKLLRAPVRPR